MISPFNPWKRGQSCFSLDQTSVQRLYYSRSFPAKWNQMKEAISGDLQLPSLNFPKDNSAEFANDDTIVEWLTQYSPEKDVTYVRGFLGRMLFAGEDGVKKVKVLSGGEKVRCMLSKLMISGANVLMLDEPTDHLDMESIDALNRGMIKFPGVMIFSSRDHQIVQTTANRIMEIINGKLIDKITTYDEYLESDEMARKRFTFTVTESDEEDD